MAGRIIPIVATFCSKSCYMPVPVPASLVQAKRRHWIGIWWWTAVSVMKPFGFEVSGRRHGNIELVCGKSE